jgi:hypothetical protein
VPAAARQLAGQAQDIQRALHVDRVSRLRHGLRARRQDRGQVEDRDDLEVGGQVLEASRIHHVADANGCTATSDRGSDGPHVECQQTGPASVGKPVHERVSELTARAGHQDQCSPCHPSLVYCHPVCARRA